MKSVLALVTGLLASCATTPQGGRYLVIRNELNDAVVAQVVFPSAAHCVASRDSLLAKSKATKLTCSPSPAPAQMTTRAVLRDARGQFIYEVETVAAIGCDDFIGHVYPDPGTEIVANCRKI